MSEEEALLEIKRLVIGLPHDTRLDLQNRLEAGEGLVTTLTRMYQDKKKE